MWLARCAFNIFGPIITGVSLGCLINWLNSDMIPYLIQAIAAGFIIMFIVKKIKKEMKVWL